jgi:hypothetical protein
VAQTQAHALQAFGPLGLTAAQTARLNFWPPTPVRVELFFLDDASTILAQVPSDPQRALLAFFDSTGAPILEENQPVQLEVTVAPGELGLPGPERRPL